MGLQNPVSKRAVKTAGLPTPAKRPTGLADQAGAAYAAEVSADHRKNHGLYLTPVAVADFMASRIAATGDTIRILDPAAGAGILLCAAVEFLVSRPDAPRRIELVAYEVDGALAHVLARTLQDLQLWAATQGVIVTIDIKSRDFVLDHAAALRATDSFLPHIEAEDAFDVVIANPPYFKLNKADPRAQAAAAVVHGQPNIYGLFMAIGAALLRDKGELVFITPRSFASGPYFRVFREKFFDCVRPEFVHVFGSRRDAFGRDAVLQENIITKGVRSDHWPRRGSPKLVVSTSEGVDDLATSTHRTTPLAAILDMQSKDKVLRLPVSKAEDDLMRLVDSWPGSLRRYGLQISTGPVVPFRATEFLDQTGAPPAAHVPLLWMNHVHAMQVRWPLGRRKPEYIKNFSASTNLLVPNRNYVLLRRFSAKEEHRRLVAGPYLARSIAAPMLGLENHLNYIYRPGGALTEDETFGIAALLSSSLLDTYFRISNGNTQVSATELRSMPLPSLEIIAAIGREARSQRTPAHAIDELVMRFVETRHSLKKVSGRGQR
ncbi:N-6 DNA methylase [Methylosinus sporium]|uniref:site-specific DNA-methyltransferase (adenine-specific) n=1 Tax=Methylosinus sporium TaxID=428 RepID=A0A549SMH9_METSR|nr:Eco57I restriction-modification methylase domain-containing protein [Methylosinus sporium]TRL30833.1 N-6 DNA methylase [Methylosinus sporium]